MAKPWLNRSIIFELSWLFSASTYVNICSFVSHHLWILLKNYYSILNYFPVSVFDLLWGLSYKWIFSTDTDRLQRGVRIIKRKRNHVLNPWSCSQRDSPLYHKVRWAVSDFLLRQAKCNRKARLARRRILHFYSTVHIWCVRARLGNSTKWLCCVMAGNTRLNRRQGHIKAWK